jgi:nitronate monooxygenase
VSLVEKLRSQMSLPVIAAPMFIVSNPNLVIAQCVSGVIGSFPALNARPAQMLDEWITSIETALAERRRMQPQAKTAPFAVNQIIHQSNDRLDHDLDVCIRHRVPIIITSLRAPTDVVKRVHEYGGAVFHDVISIRHAEKALEAGVDGLVLVCAGAGGHAGMLARLRCPAPSPTARACWQRKPLVPTSHTWGLASSPPARPTRWIPISR